MTGPATTSRLEAPATARQSAETRPVRSLPSLQATITDGGGEAEEEETVPETSLSTRAISRGKAASTVVFIATRPPRSVSAQSRECIPGMGALHPKALKSRKCAAAPRLRVAGSLATKA